MIECGLLEGQKAKISAFMEAAVRVLPRYYRPGCCIAFTRIALEVLRDRLHMKVEPVPLVVVALSQQAAELVRRLGRHPTREEAEACEGYYTVILGRHGDPGPGMWNGHLAPLVYRKVLVDATIGQMARPERGVYLGPACFAVDPDFLEGGPDGCVDFPGGCEAWFRPELDNRGYLQSRDWTDRRRCAQAVAEILEYMQPTLRRAAKHGK